MLRNERISEEFLDGIYEVYDTLMTDQIFLKLLDESSTVTNIYEETPSKVYLTPIQLVGKFSMSPEQGEQVIEGVQDYVTATIPTKGLIKANVDLSPSNYSTLEKGAINYKGVDYEIKIVKPTVNIDDVFQFYVFYCEKPKVRG